MNVSETIARTKGPSGAVARVEPGPGGGEIARPLPVAPLHSSPRAVSGIHWRMHISSRAALLVLCIGALACPDGGGRGGSGGGGGGGDAPGAPEITVELPAVDATYYADVRVPLRAVVVDDEDAAGELRVHWLIGEEVLVEGVVPDPDGVAVGELPVLDEGTYTLTTRAEDGGGRTASVNSNFTVGPANEAPECSIVSPEGGAVVAAGVVNTFEGTASDTEDDSELLTFELGVAGSRVGSGEVDQSGMWSAEVTGLVLGARTVDLTVLDSVGAECEASVQVTVSNAPSVVIDHPQDNGTVNEGAQETFLGTVDDPEDSEPSITVEWSSDVDGVLGGGNANTIGGVELADVVLSPGVHVITLEATDTDGLTGSATATVTLNAAPSAPTVSITPENPGSEATLGVSIDVDSVDPEGDEVTYSWQWFRSGAPEPFFDDGSVPSTQTSRAEPWRVDVVGIDARGAVSEVGSASVTIANALPTVDVPTVTPAIAYTDTELTCTEGATADADGDTVTVDYEWHIGGTFYSQGSTLSAFSAARGDDVTCVVTPWDGLDFGAPVSSAITPIVNSPPTAPTVTITPAAPETFHDLTCAVTTDSADGDGDVVAYSYAWDVDGASSGVTGPLVASAATTDSEVWTCNVTPDDGFGPGPVGSDSVSIGTVPMYLDVGVHSSTYSNGTRTRGYWFTAPVNLTITAVRVPTDVTGPQNVQIVRFTGGPPPEFSSSTTAHTSLFYLVGASSGADWLPTGAISVAAGDVIGVLGARGTTTMNNSYRASGAYTTDFDGNTAVLTRLIYQSNLATTAAGSLSSSATGAIGRVEMEYTVP